MNPDRLRLVGARRVLVVDDDRATREMFRTALRMGGFEVRLASDGVSALSQVEQQLPDLVVLDLDLPLLNGIAVHEELAARERTRRVPVVIVTGTEWQSPFPAFVTLRKPISTERLIDAVTTATSRSISERKSFL